MRHLYASVIVATFALVASVALAEEKKAPPKTTIGGEITKIDGQSITLTSRGDSGAKDTVITTNDETAVGIETADAVPSGKEGGNKRKVVDAKLADLKVGQKVSAIVDNGTALSITVKYEAPPKAGGEGR